MEGVVLQVRETLEYKELPCGTDDSAENLWVMLSDRPGREEGFHDGSLL